MSLSSRKQAKLVEKIRGLAKESANKKCFVCQRMGPHSNVVVSPLHAFVCGQCAGLHRSFSHRIKGISVASFSEAEVAALEANGNKRERRKWLAKYKEADCPINDESSTTQVQKFMNRMFEKKEWYSSKPSRRRDHLKQSPASNSSRHKSSSRRQRDRDRDRRDARSDDGNQSDSAMSSSSHKSRHHRRRRDDRRSRRGADTDTPRSQAGARQKSDRRSSTSSEAARSTAAKTNTPSTKEAKPPAQPQESGLVDLLDNLILTPQFGRQQSKSAELDDTLLGQEKETKDVAKDADDDFDAAAFPDDDGTFGGSAGGANGANGSANDAKKMDDAFSHLVPAQPNNSLHTNGPTSANFEKGIIHLLSVLSQVQMQYQFSDLELKNACRSALERLQNQNSAMAASRLMAAQTGAYGAPPVVYPYPGGPGPQMMSPRHAVAMNGMAPGGGHDAFVGGGGGDNPFDDMNGGQSAQAMPVSTSPWNNVRSQYAPQHAAGGFGGQQPASAFGNFVSQAMQHATPAAAEDEDANNPFA